MVKEAEHWRTTDSEGRIMPWYTRGACAWLDKLHQEGQIEGLRIWEYGGGVSTLWYRACGALVKGVDSIYDWAKIAGLQWHIGMDYISAITGEFDFICIDGDDRDKCFVYALNHLAPGGTIIIDNWKQASAGWPHWPETERLIREMNLKVTEYPQEGHPDWVTITVTR